MNEPSLSIMGPSGMEKATRFSPIAPRISDKTYKILANSSANFQVNKVPQKIFGSTCSFVNTNQQEVENLKARDSFSLNIRNLDAHIDQKGHHVTEAEANKEETNSFRNQSSVAGSNYLM